MDIDDQKIPRQGSGQQRKLRIASIILWTLVISILAALQLNGTGALAVANLFSTGLLAIGIVIVVLGVGGILFKTLQYVGLTVRLIFRLFYLIIFIIGISLLSTFVL